MCPDYRFVPRHEDELELEVDDPLLVEVQAEDFWYEGYNMRTGARGIFPAYYAIEVTKEPEHIKKGGKQNIRHKKEIHFFKNMVVVIQVQKPVGA